MGQLFPAARSKAEAIRAKAIFAPANRENFLSGDLTGDGFSLIKLYLPERIRDTDFISMFAPSEGSIKSDAARPVTGKTVAMAAAVSEFP